LRLRKFAPALPIIYPATASQIAVLGSEAPQALISFYARLAACQKDMEDVANYYERLGKQVPSEKVAFLASRLHRTLAPGLKAFETLSGMVDGAEKIEGAAISELDQLFKHDRSEQTLRERIAHYAAKPAGDRH